MMVKKQVMSAVLGILVIWGNQKTFALTILDPAYQAETYVTYDYISHWPANDMTFSPNGNLYITHHQEYSSGQTDGWIYRITPDKTVEPWITGISRPEDIVWAGGTAFGDYLYFTEGFDNIYNSGGGLTRINPDGSIHRFATSGFNQPVSLGVDRTGNYGGNMYVGSGAGDRINKVLPSGQVTSFYTYVNPGSGAPYDIVFDPGDLYNGAMYVASVQGNLPELNGILRFDPDGNPTRFAPDIEISYDLAFDSTETGSFGNYLYAVAKEQGDYVSSIYRVYPDGQAELFISDLWGQTRMAFGPDGALYIGESHWGNNTVQISRVIPEPATMSLMSLGLLGLYRRRKNRTPIV